MQHDDVEKGEDHDVKDDDVEEDDEKASVIMRRR